jgi:hypothetical protein
LNCDSLSAVEKDNSTEFVYRKIEPLDKFWKKEKWRKIESDSFIIYSNVAGINFEKLVLTAEQLKKFIPAYLGLKERQDQEKQIYFLLDGEITWSKFGFPFQLRALSFFDSKQYLSFVNVRNNSIKKPDPLVLETDLFGGFYDGFSQSVYAALISTEFHRFGIDNKVPEWIRVGLKNFLSSFNCQQKYCAISSFSLASIRVNPHRIDGIFRGFNIVEHHNDKSPPIKYSENVYWENMKKITRYKVRSTALVHFLQTRKNRSSSELLKMIKALENGRGLSDILREKYEIEPAEASKEIRKYYGGNYTTNSLNFDKSRMPPLTTKNVTVHKNLKFTDIASILKSISQKKPYSVDAQLHQFR